MRNSTFESGSKSALLKSGTYSEKIRAVVKDQYYEAAGESPRNLELMRIILEADFCVAALREALARYGSPRIFNTDQGCQFTSIEFVEVLKEAGVRISMDSKGRWMDNIMIEWLWRSLKYECVYLHAFETGNEAKARIGRWVTFYNEHRPYSRLDDKMHDEAYSQTSWTRPLVPVDSQATA